MPKPKVLVTGATGQIGRTIMEDLDDRWELTGTSRSPNPDPRIIQLDFSDLDETVAAFAGHDAIVHMHGKANHDTDQFEPYLQSNIIDLYAAYEATRRAGVKRFIFASSNHAAGWQEIAGEVASSHIGYRPDGFYGAAKVYGEALGRYYTDRYGLEVICLRIGSYKYRAEPPVWEGRRILSTWISARDMSQLITRSVETPGIEFGVYYGVSNNARSYWDITGAVRDLGYIPLDNAEHWAGQVIGAGGMSGLWGLDIPGVIEEGSDGK